ncbi:unnamed protein product, partial [Mesorhabditis belari]|uniref:Ferric-chelate reductase 1 n=1 Tax=Mesorhabditis belari TaxID=2138241 RepID=A0AAF3F3U7_9BILA
MRWPPLIWTLLLPSILAHFDASKCGSQKKCIYVPSGCEKNNVCKNIFSYKTLDDEFVEIELYSTEYTAGTNYVAVGFSKDDLMGDDPVTQCVFPDGGGPEAHASYNFGKSNQPVQDPEEKEAEKTQIQLQHAHKDDNSIYCQIHQKISSGSSAFFPNLDQEHKLFLVRGKARKPEILGIHSLDPSSPDFPFISDERHNLAKREIKMKAVSENRTDSNLPDGGEQLISKKGKSWMKAFHGILMIFAWLVFVPMAVFAARYFRDHWPGSAPRGLKWWFHLHRTLNFIALLFVLLSVLLIFWAEEWEWKGPVAGHSSESNWHAGSVHSLLGVMAAIVAVLNPFMALFRCAPDTGARPIFNWTHRTLGIAGFLLAMATLFIAANFFIGQWSDPFWALTLVLIFWGLLVVAVLLFEILDWMKTKTDHKVHHLEMRGRGKYDDNGRIVTHTKVLHQRPMHGTTILWILFGLISITIAVTLSVFMIVKRIQ